MEVNRHGSSRHAWIPGLCQECLYLPREENVLSALSWRLHSLYKATAIWENTTTSSHSLGGLGDTALWEEFFLH